LVRETCHLCDGIEQVVLTLYDDDTLLRVIKNGGPDSPCLGLDSSAPESSVWPATLGSGE
jgi:hypothetical protein